MRARRPDVEGVLERDGVTLGYEVYGEPSADGVPTVVLMPTWTIIHARFWKLQIPYLARHFHVVVYDGPGNGRSDRVIDPTRYSPQAAAADAAAVLDACNVERFVAVGLSRGAWYALELAGLRPRSIAGLVMIGASIPLAPALPQRADIGRHFFDPAPDPPQGWDRYNLAYWRADYAEFVRWFFGEAMSEPHSTKGQEDSLGWAMETSVDVLEAEALHPWPGRPAETILAELSCPTLVVHGSDDRIIAHDVGVEAARVSGGTLVTFEGSGHLPNLRDPVRFNLLLREFVERQGR